MSCIWNLFRKKKAPPEVKVVNPLLLDTLPMNLEELKTYVDTRFIPDQYGSNANFEIELPQTVECLEPCIIHVDELV